uniref:Uncharacterized protein n=1 Tax=Vannella robusta TaxID=1487602 RepID=A0A7S4HMF7_9EUKA|mmetsp:Transcript_12885/g.16091  ORF Transcript_12885/g.16091 Transcript_12885/m.16091 type:complete len:386 (+) Transcript_12885:52-1209(+)
MNNKTLPSFVPPPEYGVDKDDSRFFKSFRMDEEEEYRKFLDVCGFVVIRDVVSREDCDKTVDKIWELLSEITGNRVQRDDPNTWEDWPTQKTGILGVPIASDAMAWKNRQSKNIKNIFNNIYNEDDLLVSVDRYNIMRPTKNINFGANDVKDRDDWKGLASWFHWDLNPWHWSGAMEHVYDKGNSDFEEHGLLFSHNLAKLLTEGNDTPKRYKDSKKLQGLVALADTSFATGGFQCVPGFVGNVLTKWVSSQSEDLKQKFKGKHFVGVPRTDPLIEYAQVIGLPKGSLLIWSSELPHCNRMNESEQFRYCQYIKMIPTRDVSDLPGRAKVVANALTHAFVGTKDVSPVLGLQYRYERETRKRIIAHSLLFAALCVLLAILFMVLR